MNDLSSIFIKHDEKLEEIKKYKNLKEIQNSILSSTINYNIQLEKNHKYSLFIYLILAPEIFRIIVFKIMNKFYNIYQSNQ